jgi:hypothetical protein
MRGRPECLVVAAISLCMVFGCAGTAGYSGITSHGEAKDHVAEVVKPSGIHEDCLELSPGQVLTYSYEASAPLSFNIHYHDNSHVIYAVKKDSVSSDSGSMKPEIKHHYCLMWTNTHKEYVKITYSYRVEDKH